jgi:hypothetical protein
MLNGVVRSQIDLLLGERTMPERLEDVLARAARELARAGFAETGGGGVFTMYSPPAFPWLAIYLSGDGRWEYHDFSIQTSDDSQLAQAKGEGAGSLKQRLAAWMKDSEQ